MKQQTYRTNADYIESMMKQTARQPGAGVVKGTDRLT